MYTLKQIICKSGHHQIGGYLKTGYLSSSSCFIGSVRLRSMERARVRLVLDVPNCFAISERDNFTFPLWESDFLSPPFLYPHSLTYSTAILRCDNFLYYKRATIKAVLILFFLFNFFPSIISTRSCLVNPNCII